jgi:Fe2+ transport system protein FeoA
VLLLQHPRTCPHGQPLDPEQPDDTVRLSTLGPGEQARVARMGDEEPEFLATVDQLGLRPNTRLTVTERLPGDGPMTVAVGEQLHTLGEDVARAIWVEKLD